jgi:hypothetical protein
MSSSVEIERAGVDKHETLRFPRFFTRFELLDMFRVAPPVQPVEDLLFGHRPGRAVKYWNDAMGHLQERRIVRKGPAGFPGYREIQPMPATREGWQKFWLYGQQLEILPTEESANDIKEISKRATRVRKSIGAKRSGKRVKSHSKVAD